MIWVTNCFLFCYSSRISGTCMCCFLSARRITIKRLQRRPRELYAKISWATREREREKWRAVLRARERASACALIANRSSSEQQSGRGRAGERLRESSRGRQWERIECKGAKINLANSLMQTWDCRDTWLDLTSHARRGRFALLSADTRGVRLIFRGGFKNKSR